MANLPVDVVDKKVGVVYVNPLQKVMSTGLVFVSQTLQNSTISTMLKYHAFDNTIIIMYYIHV